MPNPTLAPGDAVIYTDHDGTDRDAICVLAAASTGTFVYGKNEATHTAYIAYGARLNQSTEPTDNTWVWPS